MAQYHVVSVMTVVQTYRVEAENESEAKMAVLSAYNDGELDNTFKNIDYEEQSFNVGYTYLPTTDALGE